MTTSSRKGMLPVRLGIEPDNKTALIALNLDPNLADTMTDRQLDEHVIDVECQRIKSWYGKEGDAAKGIEAAKKYKQQAMEQVYKVS